MIRRKALRPLLTYLAQRPAAADGRLPPERELAKTLGVSRGGLRAALNILEAEGKLVRHVGRGTFLSGDLAAMVERASAVDPTSEAADVDFDLGVPTNPLEVMEVRMLIEPRCARWAALRASHADLEFMSSCLRRMEETDDWRTYDHWDGALHRAICKSARNGLLLMLFDRYNEARVQVSWGELRLKALQPGWKERYHQQHVGLVETISRRDFVNAERQMRDHLDAIRRDLFGEETELATASG